MEYPVWQVPYLGGGLPIAVIAVIHVYLAHFAVGGGLFLVWTEWKGCAKEIRESWTMSAGTQNSSFWSPWWPAD
jgi:hypothetical protein